MGWWWWGGGPCDYCVSPSPFDLDFGTLDLTLGLWTSDLGLTIKALLDHFAGQSEPKVLRFENSAKKLSNDAAARIKV